MLNAGVFSNFVQRFNDGSRFKPAIARAALLLALLCASAKPAAAQAAQGAASTARPAAVTAASATLDGKSGEHDAQVL